MPSVGAVRFLHRGAENAPQALGAGFAQGSRENPSAAGAAASPKKSGENCFFSALYNEEIFLKGKKMQKKCNYKQTTGKEVCI